MSARCSMNPVQFEKALFMVWIAYRSTPRTTNAYTHSYQWTYGAYLATNLPRWTLTTVGTRSVSSNRKQTTSSNAHQNAAHGACNGFLVDDGDHKTGRSASRAVNTISLRAERGEKEDPK